jgi:Flp pilus assembly protein TadG
MVLGVVEVSYALLDQHVVTRLTREGANLISRDISLLDAGVAMQTMNTRPVDFANSSKVIFTVLKKGATVGSVNFDRVILYQRHQVGPLADASTLTTAGNPSPSTSTSRVADCST